MPEIPVPIPVIKPTEIQESFPSYLAIGTTKVIKTEVVTTKFFTVGQKI